MRFCEKNKPFIISLKLDVEIEPPVLKEIPPLSIQEIQRIIPKKQVFAQTNRDIVPI